MNKTRNYVERFFSEKQGRKENFDKRYSLRFSELESFMNEFSSADANTVFRLVLLLYEYGYARGYRSHAKEQKKREEEGG